MADLEGAKRLVMSYKGPKIRIMEVCGTHTHEIFRLGIRKLLSPHMAVSYTHLTLPTICSV